MDKVSSHAGTLLTQLTCFVSWFTKRVPGPRPQLHQRIFLSEQSCSSMHQPLLLYQTSWSSTWVHACSINPLSVHCISAVPRRSVFCFSLILWLISFPHPFLFCLPLLTARLLSTLKMHAGAALIQQFHSQYRLQNLDSGYLLMLRYQCSLFSPKFKICVFKERVPWQ